MDKAANDLIIKAKNGDKNALSILTASNEKLVWSIVNRFLGRGIEKNDLFQTGCIGLIKAVKNFDISKNVCFSTYAVPMIMGEIRKYIRDDGAVKVSRSLKELSKKVRYAADEISKETGEAANISQVAEKLGISREEAAYAYTAGEAPVSIYHEIGENLTVMDTLPSDADFEEKIADRLSLREAAKKLDEREKNIVIMRYFQNKTQTQTASLMGISQVQVSRIEKKVIEKLKKEIVNF